MLFPDRTFATFLRDVTDSPLIVVSTLIADVTDAIDRWFVISLDLSVILQTILKRENFEMISYEKYKPYEKCLSQISKMQMNEL